MGIDKQELNRRTILQLAGLSVGQALLGGCTSGTKKEEGLAVSKSQPNYRRVPASEDDGPIDRTFGDVAPFRFSGDEPDKSHQILWDIPGFLSTLGGKVPDPTERVPVVIVGGGISGLFSAYQLKRYLPIVLESAERLGGNSRGESWRNCDYSIGAAYLTAPDEGSALDLLYKELDLYRMMKVAPKDEPVEFQGRIISHFLKGDTDTAVAAQASVLERYFTETLERKNGRIYPEIPPTNDTELNFAKELDRFSFKDHIKKILATDKIHPHLDTWLEHYCWSTFGASYQDLSAAVGVNQLACEFGKIWVPPGGNALVVEQLLKKLRKAVGAQRVRTSCVVFQVRVVGDGVWVSYEREGRVFTIEAESVIFACPKFVVRKIFSDLEPEREKVIRKIRYNSYLVGNVLLNQKIPGNFYDLYLLGDGKINSKDIQAAADEDRVTDVVNATYAKEDAKNGILTLYRSFPYVGGRGQIYASGSYLRYRKEFLEQIQKHILPALGIPETAIAGVRIARWGHPMPVAQPGLIHSGQMEILHRPYENKIYFVNQDNWLNPCIEVAHAEALKWSVQLEKSLLERRDIKAKQKNSSATTPATPAAPESQPTPESSPAPVAPEVPHPVGE